MLDVDELMAELRRRVEDKKRRGIYSVDALAVDAAEGRAPFALEDLEHLRASATMRPDLDVHRSTKPVIGRVVTKVKSSLVRVSSQPTIALIQQSNTYNGHLLGYLASLGREVNRLGEGVERAHDAVREAEIDRERDMSRAAAHVEALEARILELEARLEEIDARRP